MKQLCILLFLLSLISCGKKKNLSGERFQLNSEKTKIETENLNPNMDDDFDGILNSKELILGLNPLIADIPEIEMEISNIKLDTLSTSSALYLKYEEKGKDRFQLLKKVISSYVYNKRYNKDYFITPFKIDSFYKKELFCLNEFKKSELKNILLLNPYEQKLSLEVKDKKLESDVFSILSQSLKINSFVLDDQFKSTFTINQNEEFIKEECVSLSFDSIKYKVGDQTIELKDIKNNIENELSHIVLLTNSKVEIKNIVPNSHSMKSFLKEFYPSVKFLNNDVYNLEGLQNDYNSDSELLTGEDKLKKGRWFYLASDKNTLSDKFSKGETYILAYLTIEDLTKVSELLSKKVISSTKGTSLSYENFEVGDIVEIIGDYRVNYSIQSNRRDNRFEYNAGQLNALLNLNKKESEICITLIHSGKLICPKVEGRKVIYKFVIENSDLKNSNLNLNFNAIKLNSFSYTQITRTEQYRMVREHGGRMNDGGFRRERYYIESSSQINAIEELNLNLSVSHFGLPR